jgi:tRNA pseudouridine55 synthase
VAKVRRLLKQKRVGHGGTLDPLATGVLPIAVGNATRLLPYLPGTKQYRGIIRFGVRTDSDDLAGKVIETKSAGHLTLPDIESLLPEFSGKISQIPPQYSAIQVNGKRLYDLARAGIACEVPRREVEIMNLKILGWRSGEYPELDLQVTCGEGTYIRALARDFGDRLGTGATLAGLVRELSCGMELPQSLTLEELEKVVTKQEDLPLLLPKQVLGHLPVVSLDQELEKRWFQGQRLALLDLVPGIVRVEGENQNFLGIALVTAEEYGPVLRPKVVMA